MVIPRAPAPISTDGETTPLGCMAETTSKPTEITEVVVPNAISGPGTSGGVPHALVPQATLTSTNDLAGVQIRGTGFAGAATQVLLDGTPLPAGNVAVDPTGRLITATIPHAFLSMPHHYALQVISGGFTSNPADFIVVQAVDMTKACATPNPNSVAIVDQVANGPFSPIARLIAKSSFSISCASLNNVIASPASFAGRGDL